MSGTIKFTSEVENTRTTYRDFKEYVGLEPQDFVRIHESDLKQLLDNQVGAGDN